MASSDKVAEVDGPVASAHPTSPKVMAATSAWTAVLLVARLGLIGMVLAVMVASPDAKASPSGRVCGRNEEILQNFLAATGSPAVPAAVVPGEVGGQRWDLNSSGDGGSLRDLGRWTTETTAVLSSPMPRRPLAGILWSALFCWAGAVLWISSLTPEQLPDEAFVFGDKFAHFIVFAIGGWLAASALRMSRPRAAVAGQIILAVISVAIFGAFDESLQTFTPGRQGGDVYDWIADFLGAGVGALLSLAAHERLERCVPSRLS